MKSHIDQNHIISSVAPSLTQRMVQRKANELIVFYEENFGVDVARYGLKLPCDEMTHDSRHVFRAWKSLLASEMLSRPFSGLREWKIANITK
jgi:hypothetical protein